MFFMILNLKQIAFFSLVLLSNRNSLFKKKIYKLSSALSCMKSGEFVIEDPAQYFYVNNGSVLRNLTDLLSELKTIDDFTFQHHVNAEKNDFSNWTKDVLKKNTLAKKIASLKSVNEIVVALEKELKLPASKSTKKSKKDVISQIKESVGHD